MEKKMYTEEEVAYWINEAIASHKRGYKRGIIEGIIIAAGGTLIVATVHGVEKLINQGKINKLLGITK